MIPRPHQNLGLSGRSRLKISEACKCGPQQPEFFWAEFWEAGLTFEGISPSAGKAEFLYLNLDQERRRSSWGSKGGAAPESRFDLISTIFCCVTLGRRLHLSGLSNPSSVKWKQEPFLPLTERLEE